MDPLTEPEVIAFAGDWHANTPWAIWAIEHAKDRGADVIIHTGDFGYKYLKSFVRGISEALERVNLPLLFIDGNHDYLRRIWARYPKTAQGLYQLSERLYHLPRGTRWTWDGVRFLAMGGAYSVDRNHRVKGVDWWDTETIKLNQVALAARRGPADVLISHDCPEEVLIPGLQDSERLWPVEHLQGAKRHRRMLSALTTQVQPRLIVHGHYHRKYESMSQLGYGPVHVIGLDCDGASLEKNVKIMPLDLIRAEILLGPPRGLA